MLSDSVEEGESRERLGGEATWRDGGGESESLDPKVGLSESSAEVG